MIKKPEQMNFADKKIFTIISGLPGTGKTTLALSAPNCLLIDTDEGLCRVNPAHRKDASICKTYEEIVADCKEAEGQYDTIVIDTAGALIDYLKEWAMRTDAKATKSNGGFSLQGFGIVKQEFIRFTGELKKKFNVIFLFHEEKTKNNEDIFYDLVCEGSAKTLVYQPADLAGHLFIMNNKRYIGFTPTEQYTAKSAYGIKGLVEVPELSDGEPNEFLTKLFAQVRANLAKETEELNKDKAIYDKAISDGMKYVQAIASPKDVQVALDVIAALPHALTSETELKNAVKMKMKELGIVWDKAAKAYVVKNA